MPDRHDSNQLKELEAKVAERTRELSEAYAFLDSVIENIPNMIFVKDAQTLKFVRFNRAGEQLIGLTRDQLIGKGDFDFFPKDEAEAFVAADRAVIEKRAVVDIPEEPISSRTLGLRTLHTKKIPVYDKHGDPKYLMGISEDITEMKRYEAERLQMIQERIAKIENERVTERFRFLSRASALLGSSLDYEKTLRNLAYLAVPDFADWCSIQLLDLNGALTQIAVAHKDPDKVKWARQFHQEYPPDGSFEHGSMAVIKTGKPQLANELSTELIEAYAKDERHLQILRELGLYSYLCAPIRIRDRVIGCLTLVSTRDSRRTYSEQDVQLAEDLGERAGFAIENARLYKESRHLNRVKDEFLATLSHELRTPLNVIQGHAEILKKEGSTITPADLESSIDAIQRNAQMQLTIVSDLLDVSSIITGKISFKPTAIVPGEVIATTVGGLIPVAQAKGVKLIYDVSDSDTTIWSDPSRLQQIIFNLISNAIKFTPPDGTVEVLAGEIGDEWWLSVRDTGCGIDPEFLPFVFERFRQEDSSTARKHGGLGLGLSIVRNLVELHGGHVSVESRGHDRGSVFKVVLPRSGRRTDTTPMPSPKATPAKEIADKVRFDGLKVLLVEDSADNRALIERVLRKYGAETIQADSARQAREYLKTGTPDVIVSDIGMPDENGLEFMRRLRGTLSADKVPAIALTAYVREEEKDAAYEAGFQAHVGKPVTAAELATAIATVLNKC